MNYLLWSLFGPATWPIWPAVLALVLMIVKPGWQFTRSLLLTAAGVWAIVLALLPTGQWLMLDLEADYPVPTEIPMAVGNILVLAGGEDIHAALRTGRIEFGTAGDRVAQAVPLARALPDARLWIAGYGDLAGMPTSDVTLTADYWRASGIAPTRIGEIGLTRDTCENLFAFAEEDRDGRVLLMTSAFHMRRAMACAEAAGLQPLPYPVDYRTSGKLNWLPRPLGNLAMADLALHEIIGLAYYGWTGRFGGGD
ncbi:MAG: YdcF family protein [Pacificimonas sp.]